MELHCKAQGFWLNLIISIILIFPVRPVLVPDSCLSASLCSIPIGQACPRTCRLLSSHPSERTFFGLALWPTAVSSTTVQQQRLKTQRPRIRHTLWWTLTFFFQSLTVGLKGKKKSTRAHFFFLFFFKHARRWCHYQI